MTEITTPTGYKVQFKDFLDTKGYRAIQRATLAKTEVTAGMRPEDIAIPGSVGLDAEDVALGELLVSVTLPDGSVPPDSVATIGEMPFGDGRAVYDKINELTREVTDDPKDEASSLPNTSPESPTSSSPQSLS